VSSVAYTSSFASNGQSFGGLSAPPANLAGIGPGGRIRREGTAGNHHGLAARRCVAVAVLLISMILLVAGLNFLALLCLGPVAEHMMIWY
jgi:K+-transporting ATPase A subunit